jgi:hypothetical protein
MCSGQAADTPIGRVKCGVPQLWGYTSDCSSSLDAAMLEAASFAPMPPPPGSQSHCLMLSLLGNQARCCASLTSWVVPLLPRWQHTTAAHTQRRCCRCGHHRTGPLHTCSSSSSSSSSGVCRRGGALLLQETGYTSGPQIQTAKVTVS